MLMLIYIIFFSILSNVAFSCKLFSVLICLSSLLKFSKMARYDMTGIGINLREVPDENGGVKLKVLGLILDGPAHTAGVQQVQTVGLLSRLMYSYNL